MIKATKEFLQQQQEELYDRRRAEIRNTEDNLTIPGTTYYVSNDGDDANDGKTPERAWKTLERVTNSRLEPGDGVRFRRGDVFRGGVEAQAGVCYCAYGEGPKPLFCGWDENLARPDLWQETDAVHHIWKYVKPILDPGTLVFNDGEEHSRKLIPTYRYGQFLCREDEGRVFDMAEEMKQDLDLFWLYEGEMTTERPCNGEDFPIPKVWYDSLGELYVRCDRGNPGQVFDSVEAVVRRIAFRTWTNPNVRVDNLCLKYYVFGVHGGPGHNVGLHVTNCEIGWIGGNVQHYFGYEPNDPQTHRGLVTRYGNAVEIYGGCEDYLVDNCYIYQVYDAGITHQVTTAQKVIMANIRYSNNLIERCVYGIEYFLTLVDGETESCMDGVEMCGNIIRMTGYGWGQQRHNTTTPAAIKSWSYHTNPAKNYTVHHNIFDRSAYRLLHLTASREESCPEMYDNIYIQHLDGCLGQYGGDEPIEPENHVFDRQADQIIRDVFGDRGAKVYVIE